MQKVQQMGTPVQQSSTGGTAGIEGECSRPVQTRATGTVRNKAGVTRVARTVRAAEYKRHMSMSAGEPNHDQMLQVAGLDSAGRGTDAETRL